MIAIVPSQKHRDILYCALAKFDVYDDIESERLLLLETLKSQSDRFFTHCNGFFDETHAICMRADGSAYTISKDGCYRQEVTGYSLETCLDFVFEGAWEEVYD